jgi:nucleoside-diphosphate-sugar epimerase
MPHVTKELKGDIIIDIYCCLEDTGGVTMKIFVSGASGFLGSAVTNELARRGHEVIALDNELKQSREEAYLEEVILEREYLPEEGELQEAQTFVLEEEELFGETAGKPGNIRYFFGDVSDARPEWTKELKDCDKIISLTKPFSDEEDITIDEMNKYGRKHAKDVVNLLKKAAGGKVKSAIITYHTLCLGNRGGAVLSEVDSLDPIGFCRPLEGSFEPITQAGRETGIKLVSLYPSLVYGKEGWFKKLVNNIAYGKAKMVEPGDNYLSLLHIEDLAGLYAEIAERIDEDVMYVLSDLAPVTQKEMVVHIAGLLGAPVPQMVDFETYARKFGRLEAESLSASIKVNPGKVLEDTGYSLKFPNSREGIPQVLKGMGFEMGGQFKRAA